MIVNDPHFFFGILPGGIGIGSVVSHCQCIVMLICQIRIPRRPRRAHHFIRERYNEICDHDDYPPGHFWVSAAFPLGATNITANSQANTSVPQTIDLQLNEQSLFLLLLLYPLRLDIRLNDRCVREHRSWSRGERGIVVNMLLLLLLMLLGIRMTWCSLLLLPLFLGRAR